MKAIEHTNNGKRFLLVEVPEGTSSISLGPIGLYKDDRLLFHFDKIGGSSNRRVLTLPPGQWQIVGKADILSEEQCAEIVRKKGTMYMDYLINGEPYHFAEMSLSTLLLSNNLQPSTTIILQSK